MTQLISSLESVRKVLDNSGFVIVDHLSTEQSSELERLGYNLYYFNRYNENRDQVVFRVASGPNKTYLEAQDWVWEILGLEARVNLDIRQIKIESVFVDVPESYSFDRNNDNFTGKNEHDTYFIVMHQNIFNDRLKARGYVFLNDVLYALGFEKNQAGQLMGWTKGDDVIIATQHEDNAIILKFPTAHYIFDVLKEN